MASVIAKASQHPTHKTICKHHLAEIAVREKQSRILNRKNEIKGMKERRKKNRIYLAPALHT